MAVLPLMICKKCGYISVSAFGPFGSNGSVTVTACTQSCAGCGTMLGHPDVFSGGGGVHVINRDPNVVLVLANLFEAVRSGRNPTVTEMEYQKLPAWARNLLDAVRGNRKLTGCAIIAIIWMINRGADLAQVTLESHLDLRNSMLLLEKQAYLESAQCGGKSTPSPGGAASPSPLSSRSKDLPDSQQKSDISDAVVQGPTSGATPDLLPRLLEDAIQRVPRSAASSRWRQLLIAMQEADADLWELRNGHQVTPEELRSIVNDYNRALNRLYSAIAAESRANQPQWVLPEMQEPTITIVGPGLISKLRRRVPSLAGSSFSLPPVPPPAQ